jgi:hypothetical protein
LFIAGGLRVAAPTSAEIALNPKIYAQLEKQLAKNGVDSIRKGLLRAEQTLATHETNAITYGNQGGPISAVNKTVENVASQIKTMKQFLADKGL